MILWINGEMVCLLLCAYNHANKRYEFKNSDSCLNGCAEIETVFKKLHNLKHVRI